MTETGSNGILVLNAGSSSVKFAVFDVDLAQGISGQIAGIGGKSSLTVDGRKKAVVIPDHGAALAVIFGALAARNIPLNSLLAVAHRVVHGGPDLSAPVRICPGILAQIKECVPLAPLHNPHNILAIELLSEQAPNLPQYASFDTGFHATNPDVATRYAVPDDWHNSNIRRFGFHGLSYQSLVASYSTQTGAAVPDRLLAFHLGNGASICAILKGRSVATTMGYSPLDGLTMGTRSGSIDAGAVLRMVKTHGAKSTLETLNEKSGLFALSGGVSDMEALLESDAPEAKFAVEHFCYWAARHAGSMIAAMGGVDAFAFTGGIGENAAVIGNRIKYLLAWAGVPPANTHIIPAREERQIAQNALRCMHEGGVR